MTWTHTLHLRYSDLDYIRHVTAAAYLTHFEEARARWLAQLWQTSLPTYVVVHQELDYLSEVRLEHSPLTISVRAVEVRRSSFDIAEVLTIGTGEVMTRSAATLLTFDPEARRSRPLTEQERAALER
jgi:acyl-CoA thioester hydrolase